MVEFQVLKCGECRTFQVLQVTKTRKWACKLCGLKQSTTKVYGQGTGADCRKHVQKLNSLRGEIEWTSQEQSLKPLSSVSASSHLGQVNQNQNKSSHSRWSQFVDDKDKEIQEDMVVSETEMMVFSDWAQTCHKNKSQRSSVQTNEASSCKRLKNSGGHVVNGCKSFQKPGCQQKKDWRNSSINLSTRTSPEQASFKNQFSEIVTDRTSCLSSTAVLHSEKTLDSKDRCSVLNSGTNSINKNILVLSSSSQWHSVAGSCPMFSRDQLQQKHGTEGTLNPGVHHQKHNTERTLDSRVHHREHGTEGRLNPAMPSVTKSVNSKWHSFLRTEDPLDEDSDEDVDGQVQDLLFRKNLKVPVNSSLLPGCLLELSDGEVKTGRGVNTSHGVNTGRGVNIFQGNDAKSEVCNSLVNASLRQVRYRPPDSGLSATFHLNFDIDEDLQV